MGSVWRASHGRGGHPVAIKVLTDGWARNPRSRELFAAEVSHLAGLDHPHVVRVIDYGEAGPSAHDDSDGQIPSGSPWLAMELARTSLRREAPAHWEAIRAVAEALLSALAHAHARGVVHCDVKPDNVLMGCGSQTTHAIRGLRLADFGLSLGRPVADKVAGSPCYMAPEQFGRRDIGPWTDLYALGCTLWEWVTGRPPFEGELSYVKEQHFSAPLPALDPRMHVPSAVGDWLCWLLEKHTQERPQLAADALVALRALDSGSLVTSPPPFPERWSDPSTPRLELQTHDAGLGLLACRRPRLTGRIQQRNTLWHALDRTVAARPEQAHPSPRAVVLEGATGAGTNTLAHWLVERAQEVGAARGVVARPVRAGRASRLAAALLDVLGCTPEMGRQEVESWLTHKTRVLGAADDWLAGALAAWAYDDAQAVGPVLVEAARLLCRTRPLVLVLPCVPSTVPDLDAIAWLMDSLSIEPLPVLVLLTYQSDADGRVDALAALKERDDVVTLSVGAMPPESLEAQLQAALPLDPELAAELVRRSAGNPGVAMTLLGSLSAQGALQPGPHGFSRAPDVQLAAPGRNPWLEQVQACVPGPHSAPMQALERAAAIGLQLPIDIWRRTTEGYDPAGIAATLERRGLMSRTRRGWRFGHELIRQGLEQHARTHGRWRVHHEVCAQRRTAAPPRIIGHHWLEAGHPQRAIEPLHDAAVQLLRTGRPRRAEAPVASLQRAITLLELPHDHPTRGLTRLRVAQLRLALGQPGGVSDDLAELLQDCRTHGWSITAEVQLERSVALRLAGRVVDALGPVTEAARDPAHRVEALLGKARLHLMVGQLEECDVTYRELACLDGLLSPHEQARAWLGRSQLSMHLGRLAEARQHITMALGLLDQVSSPVVHADTHICFASILRATAEHDRSIEHWRAAYAQASRTALRPKQVDALVGLGDALHGMGHHEDAERAFVQAANLARRTGGAHEVATLNHALVRLDLGDPKSAIRLAEPLLQSPIMSILAMRTHTEALLLQANAALGEWREAEHWLHSLEEHPAHTDPDLARMAHRTASLPSVPDELARRCEQLASRLTV